MENGKCQNRIEWKGFKNEMEDNLPYYYISCVVFTETNICMTNSDK